MQKIFPLETLRGFAAVAVILFHFRIGSSFNNLFTDNAWLMVDFFFVLSGFVMSLSYGDRLATGSQIGAFALRRFRRLYPLHLLVLLCFVGLEAAKLVLAQTGQYDPQDAAFSGPRSIPALLAHLALLQNFLLPIYTWNIPSWSFSAEFYTYLLFAALLFAFSRYRTAGRVAALLLLICGQQLWQAFGDTPKNIEGPARCLFAFFLGHLTCEVHKHRPSAERFLAAPLMLILSVALVASAQTFPHALVTLIPLAFAGTIYAVVRSAPRSLTSRILSLPPLVYLGTISFGIYMWHSLIIYCVGVVSKVVFKLPVTEFEGGVVVTYDTLLTKNLVTIFVLTLSIALAALSHRYFESRFYQPRRRTVPDAAADAAAGKRDDARRLVGRAGEA